MFLKAHHHLLYPLKVCIRKEMELNTKFVVKEIFNIQDLHLLSNCHQLTRQRKSQELDQVIHPFKQKKNYHENQHQISLQSNASK